MKVKIIPQTNYNQSEIDLAIKNIFESLDIYSSLKDKQIILIKPNLLGAHQPEKAVTTHPAILEAVIKILIDLKKEIIVGDSPGGIVKAQHVWKVTGIEDVCKKYNVKLVDFGKDGVIEVKSSTKKAGLIRYVIDKNVLNCDAIINLPKMKTHSLMLYTGAVKNLYGVIPGLYKSELHKEYPSPVQFSEVLSELYTILKPKIILNIIDGVLGMDGEGPSAGNPSNFNLIIASRNASSADYIASKIMGFDINDITYLKNTLHNDAYDLSKISSSLQVEEKWLNFILPDININTVKFRNKFLTKIPKFMKDFIKAFFTYYPDFLENCKLCEVCIKSCPVLALKTDKEGKKIILEKNKCIKCLCCHEMCPYSAIYIKKSLLSRLIFR